MDQPQDRIVEQLHGSLMNLSIGLPMRRFDMCLDALGRLAIDVTRAPRGFPASDSGGDDDTHPLDSVPARSYVLAAISPAPA
jgi:hypothetical protein